MHIKGASFLSTGCWIGQHAFRQVILEIYQNRCCLTGLDLPAVNRASHSIGWAERRDTRMDPRNGLCLSATNPSTWRSRAVLGVALNGYDHSR